MNKGLNGATRYVWVNGKTTGWGVEAEVEWKGADGGGGPSAMQHLRVKTLHKSNNLIKTFVLRLLALCSKALPWKPFYSLWATRGLDSLGRHLYFN